LNFSLKNPLEKSDKLYRIRKFHALFRAITRLRRFCAHECIAEIINKTVDKRIDFMAIKKTKDQLIREVAELNQRISELETSEGIHKKTEDLREHVQLEEALLCTNYKLHAMVYEYCLRYQRISIFNQMSEKLQSCTSLEETYPIISQFSQKLFPVEAGKIFILDELSKQAVAVTGWGNESLGNAYRKRLTVQSLSLSLLGNCGYHDSMFSDDSPWGNNGSTAFTAAGKFYAIFRQERIEQ
jgi:hypothetical protein